MAESKYNVNSAAVKRILQEIREMNEASDVSQFVAEAIDDDIFEWHFVIRGPPATDFEGGLYHGRIILPAEYPFKPPSFVMLTPSGRFETHVKICLSISSYHPEQWQPSWSMRTALTALIAFFPSAAQGAVGSMDATPELRRELALKSRTTIPTVSSAARAQIMQKLHAKLMQMEEKTGATSSAAQSSVQDAATVSAQALGTSNPPSHEVTACGNDAVASALPEEGHEPESHRSVAYLKTLDDLLIAVLIALAALIGYRVLA